MGYVYPVNPATRELLTSVHSDVFFRAAGYLPIQPVRSLRNTYMNFIQISALHRLTVPFCLSFFSCFKLIRYLTSRMQTGIDKNKRVMK